MKKVEHAAEPSEIDFYTKIPPPKKSPNQLTRWQSMRPESSLEKSHESLAHFANTSMKPVLAEILTLAGVAQRNVVCRWKYHLNQYRLQGHEPHMPVHFADVPRHLDHSLLHALNNEAQTLGLSTIFNFVTPIRPDRAGSNSCYCTTTTSSRDNRSCSFSGVDACSIASCACDGAKSQSVY